MTTDQEAVAYIRSLRLHRDQAYARLVWHALRAGEPYPDTEFGVGPKTAEAIRQRLLALWAVEVTA